MAFGHEQETVEVGRVKASGHLTKEKLDVRRVKFEHEIQRDDEITMLEDASGLIHGMQQRDSDCRFEDMMKIKLIVSRDEVTAGRQQKDLRDRVIDCTDHNELAWGTQGTDWNHYRGKEFLGKETQTSSWLNNMEEFTDEEKKTCMECVYCGNVIKIGA